ncbi:MAG: endonuclease/exonuclease/phosphatase family protein [Phycisphaeraceae bacterium]
MRLKIRRPKTVLAVLCLVALPIVLFVINGTLLSYGQRPLLGTTTHAAAPLADEAAPVIVKVLSYNIAKGFVHQGGLCFADRQVVAARMERIAALINAEQPDMVFLSEAVLECGPCPVNQVTMLAQATGMHAWAFGENFNIGVPGYRMVGGNAIFSRWPLEAVGNPSLAGRRPFYITRNNRRLLWCAVHLAGRWVLLASVHNDSFNPANNLIQTRELLDFAPHEEALIAGDFNAQPHEPSMTLLRDSGRFAGMFDGALTFPSDEPRQRIDFILAPARWELLEDRVLDSDASDHRPVVAVFRIPP